MPAAQFHRLGNAAEALTEPVERGRAGGPEHHVVEQRGAQQAVPHPEHQRRRRGALLHGHDEVDPVIEIRPGERVGWGHVEVVVGGAHERLKIAAVACANRCGRRHAADHDRRALGIGDHELAGPMAHLHELEMIEVMRLHGFVADVETDGAGRIGAGFEAIEVAAFEQGRDAAREELGFLDGSITRVHRGARPEDRDREDDAAGESTDRGQRAHEQCRSDLDLGPEGLHSEHVGERHALHDGVTGIQTVLGAPPDERV